MAIKKITVTIGDKDFDMTMEEAEELHKELGTLFKSKCRCKMFNLENAQKGNDPWRLFDITSR